MNFEEFKNDLLKGIKDYLLAGDMAKKYSTILIINIM